MSFTIAKLIGESIKDSRGIPTLKVTVVGSDGSSASFAVPSGASTGIHEAHELRDDGTSHGDVTKAIAYIHGEISDALIGKSLTAQREVDELLIALDGTDTKERLGGNTLIGISIALAKTAAASEGKEVWQYLHENYFNDRTPSSPKLYANIINGGKHAATKLAFQEYHIVPKKTTVHESLELISRIQEKLYEVACERFPSVVTGDEGGYALPYTDVQEPLALLHEVATLLNVRDDVEFALDVAASSFFDEAKGGYSIGDEVYDTHKMMQLYQDIVSTYGLLSVEDPFHEEDFTSFTELKKNGKGVIVVGDDLTTTSKKRLIKAVASHSVDALIIKPNQIGTLIETIEAMQYAHTHDVKCIVSHRSGETLDDFIADLAYASGAFGIKAGARGPKEREVKYSRLLAIEKKQVPSVKTSVKIITTLGPATNTKERIADIISAGADIARLNFSWGTYENMLELITYVREVAQEKGVTIPILQDLSGPRLVMNKGHKINNAITEVITEKDKQDLIFGLDNAVEYVALSYVSGPDDIHALRNLMVLHGNVTPIIAKIERQEALDNLHAICDAADGIMIARGDLGTAVPIEELPLLEKDIIELCNEKQKFVIVATEMMLTMVENETPSRAEVNDVATAVSLGANAVMLSEESARGKHPVETVRMMKKIVSFTEEEKITPHHLI